MSIIFSSTESKGVIFKFYYLILVYLHIDENVLLTLVQRVYRFRIGVTGSSYITWKDVGEGPTAEKQVMSYWCLYLKNLGRLRIINYNLNLINHREAVDSSRVIEIIQH